MIRKIINFMEKYNMIQDADTVIVGLSGGADSVCLLRTLHEIRAKCQWDFHLIGVHVNHGIRGEEALRDQQFSKELCERLGISFQCVSIDVPSMAKELGMSEEEAGRKARYDIFAKIADQTHNAVIAVAHHRNDQAETVLMNLLRGSGLKGLCGISPVRMQGEHRIVRPLLCVTRQEIEQYLSGIDQDYITDSTNQNTEYTRNKLRNDLIPYLEDQFNPNVTGAICDMAENLFMTEVYLERQAATLYKSTVRVSSDQNHRAVYLSVVQLGQADPVLALRVVRNAISELTGAVKDIYRSHVEGVYALCNMQVGKRIDLPYGAHAIRTYDEIILTFSEEQETDNSLSMELTKEQLNQLEIGDKIELPVRQSIFIEGIGYRFLKNIVVEMAETLENSFTNVYTKYFDYDKIKSNIYLRYRKTGDCIVIHPDGATKKLKNDLIDRKIAKSDRDHILLLTDDKHILWAIGVRRGEDNRVDNTSRRILKINVELQEE